MTPPDLDALLNFVLPFAQEMLAKRGAFYPFGATMKSDGQINQSAAYTGAEFPESPQLIDLLMGASRAPASKGEVRATPLCFDARAVTQKRSKASNRFLTAMDSGNSIVASTRSVCAPKARKWRAALSH